MSKTRQEVVTDAETAFQRLANELGKSATAQEVAVALAQVLHHHLAIDNPHRRIPRSQPSEVLMRAIIASLEDATENGEYIARKLRTGVKGLVENLCDSSPKFLAEVQHEPYFAEFLPEPFRSQRS